MMLGCGVIWMLRTTCMVRKDREQIQEGIKGYIGKENRRTAPAGKTNREQVAVQLRKL